MFNLFRLKIVDRYMGGSTLYTTIFAVVVLSLVLVLANIFRQVLPKVINEGVPFGFVLEFIGNILPASLAFTVPWGYLTAVLLLFGRLSADNELTSLRMCGLSILRICAPVLIIGVGLSMLCLYINVDVAPRAEAKIKAMFTDELMSNPMAVFKKDEVISQFDRKVIWIGDKSDDELLNFQMFELDERKRPARFIYAESVKPTMDTESKELSMPLREMHSDMISDARTLQKGVTLGSSVGYYPFSISLEELQKKKVKPAQLTNGQLIDAIGSGELDKKKRTSYMSEISKRFSLSAACLTFAFIGIPLGVTAQRRETSVGFVLSLIVAIVYFLFFIVTNWFHDKPSLFPYVLMWLPNIIFMALGYVLFRKLSKR